MKEQIRSRRGEIRTIWTLAWPAIVEQALQTVVQYVDTGMVGRLGAKASAAVGLTVTITWTVNSLFYAMGTGILSCIAKAMGAEKPEKVHKAAVQAFLAMIVMGFAVGALCLLLSPFLPVWLGAKPEVLHDAFLYFVIVSIPMPFRASGIIFGSTLRATGDTRTPMAVNALINALNIVLNYLLIGGTRTVSLFGLTSFTVWGAGLGVSGAAIATAISQTLGGVLMFAAVRRSSYLSFKRREIRLDRAVMRECVGVAVPVAGQRLAVSLGEVVYVALVSRLGTVAIAAHSIAITAEQAFYVPGLGLNAAAATLAGNAVGEKDEQKLMRISETIMLMTAALMTVLSILLFLFPGAMMSIFTKDPEVIASGASVLRIVAVSEPLFGILIILEGVFNGIGDAKVPFVYAVFSMWGVRILSTAVCIFGFGLGLNAAWICMVADNVSRFGLLLFRFTRGNWKKKYF